VKTIPEMKMTENRKRTPQKIREPEKDDPKK